jgi:Ca2+-binding EF-hand superfamily protein
MGVKMTERNFKQELSHSFYYDMENGNDTETIDYDSLIGIITELCDRIEQLEKDNELLKSYAWEK